MSPQPKLDLHYVDPRLVELYDLANPPGPDTAFFIQLAEELAAHTIVDLGCGTGAHTRALAAGNRVVFGVDPSAAMLAVARRNDAEQRIKWIEGTSEGLGTLNADLAIMTGNVAQIFLDDAEWAKNLANLRQALRPGGWLAFESRNPVARGWEAWTPEATRTVTATPFGPVEEWLAVVEVGPRTVKFKGYNLFQQTQECAVVESELRFRSLGELTASLEAAGFSVQRVYGDWGRGPLVETSRIIILLAQRI